MVSIQSFNLLKICVKCVLLRIFAKPSQISHNSIISWQVYLATMVRFMMHGFLVELYQLGRWYLNANHGNDNDNDNEIDLF